MPLTLYEEEEIHKLLPHFTQPQQEKILKRVDECIKQNNLAGIVGILIRLKVALEERGVNLDVNI